jgi:D-alanine-D-alanine ligase
LSKPRITVLLGDPRLPDRTKPQGGFGEEDLDQVARLKAALSEIDDYRFEYWDDHERLPHDLRLSRPEFVLNFCDTGYRNEPLHELHVAALLELEGIPYSGSGPAALGMCYDKSLVRVVARESGVPVPWEFLLRPDDDLPEIGYPAFIKPNRGDGSFGITADAIVHDEQQARVRLQNLRADLPGQAILVQEFLDGAEYGVGAVGNPGDAFDILPVIEVDYTGLHPDLPRLLDYGSKTDPDSPYWSDIDFRPARLDEKTRRDIKAWCATLFDRLGLRDYGRCDFRTDAQGGIKLMEVNPNPAWCWDGKLAKMVGFLGEGHSGLLRRIIEASRRRCFGGDVRADPAR